MIVKGETNPYAKPQVYWCSCCDAIQVDSTKPETGNFYQVFGHEFSTDDYTSIFFALCLDCKMENYLKPVLGKK